VTNFCICNCDLEKIINGIPLTEINNVIDDSAYRTYGARGHTKA